MSRFLWSLWAFAWAAGWGILSYVWISGYSQPGFARTVSVDDDGNEGTDLVWNDAWPLTVLLAIGSLWLAIYLMRCWALNRETNFDWVGELLDAIADS